MREPAKRAPGILRQALPRVAQYLRWLANISPHLQGSLSATGGVHTSEDAIKALLAGAHTIQLVSVLLKHGPRYLYTLLQGLRKWMEEHGYESANYIRVLQSWRV